MKELDKAIEEKALQKAQEKVNEARSEIEMQIEEKEENMDDIIAEMAELIIKQNEKYIGKDVKNKAIEKLNAENHSCLRRRSLVHIKASAGGVNAPDGGRNQGPGGGKF